MIIENNDATIASHKPVRVRVAPSPTGMVHVGTAHSAYFNYAFAAKHNGTFIVRLDDTDKSREVEGSEEKIYELFHWLGLSWQEGADIGGPYAPYKQTQRYDRYREVAKELVEDEKAYVHEGAVFISVGDRNEIRFTDLIHGEVVFNRSELKDLVIMRSDKTPTYHFATVIDEIDHKITHVIRGEDHLSNTPKHLMIYEALGESPPYFAHLPLLRNPDKSKLSKRQGHVSLQWYKDEGILPEALKNFFGLMGWSHPDGEEVFDVNNFIAHFTLEDINPTAPVFDLEKLKWLNGVYIRNLSVAELSQKLIDGEFIDDSWRSDRLYFERVVKLSQERMRTLREFVSATAFFFQNMEHSSEIVALVLSHIDKQSLTEYIADVVAQLSLDDIEWTAVSIESLMRELQEKHHLKPKDAFMSIRLIITGQLATPPLFETMEVLGKDTVISRVRNFMLPIKE